MSSPGEVITGDGNVELNPGRERVTVNVRNTGDRPVQVGSHYHFFEANKALEFDRTKTFGMRLDIPAGTAVRFEPGGDTDVVVIPFAGIRRIHGFSGLTSGYADSPATVVKARRSAVEQGFAGATED